MEKKICANCCHSFETIRHKEYVKCVYGSHKGESLWVKKEKSCPYYASRKK